MKEQKKRMVYILMKNGEVAGVYLLKKDAKDEIDNLFLYDDDFSFCFNYFKLFDNYKNKAHKIKLNDKFTLVIASVGSYLKNGY